MKKKLLNGIMKRHPDGFGFFIPENPEEPDVYIPQHHMKSVMTSDRVSVEVYPEGKNSTRFRGEVVEVLERGIKQAVGRYFPVNDEYGIVRDEGKGWGQDLRIPHEFRKDAKEKDLVLAEIFEYPGENSIFQGKIKQNLGDVSDAANDIRRVVATQGLPDIFPDEVLAEAKQIPHVPHESDFLDRTDLRSKTLMTIDGATAKDFDDAVCTEVSDRGFKLYVAIADVSHYVKQGTAIDDEAYIRGNSVYFPNFVIPMLPEALSNGLCSLNPNVPRLCVVAEIDFDFQGNQTNARFYEAVMESKARVTYGQAQEIVDEIDLPQFRHVRENILRCADLAKILMAKRYREGSLDLEIPETEMVIDASGVPIDMIRSERLFSHRLIEELMLAANVAVARFFTQKEIPGFFRIHEPPNSDALEVLEKYLNNFGGSVSLERDRESMKQGHLQKRLTKALQEFEARPEGLILHILTLRSMSQAKYSSNNLGHFGLGFENYTHFTSPIRRYPDLIVHRILKALVLPSSKGYKLVPEEDLQSAGTMLSATEQKAAKSERQIKSIKKARFLSKHLGEEHEGIVSSVVRFGMFVLLREFDVDGLVRLDDLGKDSFIYDEDTLMLVGRRSGMKFSIGDHVKIQVLSTDTEQGQVNFGLVEKLSSLVKDSTPEYREQKQHRRDQKNQNKSGREGTEKNKDRKRDEKAPRGKRRQENNRSSDQQENQANNRHKNQQNKNKKDPQNTHRGVNHLQDRENAKENLFKRSSQRNENENSSENRKNSSTERNQKNSDKQRGHKDHKKSRHRDSEETESQSKTTQNKNNGFDRKTVSASSSQRTTFVKQGAKPSFGGNSSQGAKKSSSSGGSVFLKRLNSIIDAVKEKTTSQEDKKQHGTKNKSESPSKHSKKRR